MKKSRAIEWEEKRTYWEGMLSRWETSGLSQIEFCRRNDLNRNGFCLFHKRLEKHRFKWPQKLEQVKQIDSRDLSFLLEGLDISRIRPHESLFYKTVI